MKGHLLGFVRGHTLYGAAAAALLFGVSMLLAGCQNSQAAMPELLSAPADRVFASTIAVKSGSTDDLLAAARAYEQVGNASAGLALRYAVAERDGADVAGWQSLASEYWSRADWNGAKAALDALLHLEPAHPYGRYHAAILLLPHNLREAYAHLDSVSSDAVYGPDAQALRDLIGEIETAPASVQALRIGMALSERGFWGQAEQAFGVAVTLAPEHAESWAYLGIARAQQARPATVSFAQALAMQPEDALINMLAGLGLRIQGDLSGSLAYLTLARELAPEDPAVVAELGTAYRLLGDLSSAERWLVQAVQLAPADATFLKVLAEFYAEEAYDLTGNGLVVLQEAVEQLAEDSDVWASYGWARYNVQDIQAAEEALAWALALEPENPRALYYQGLVAYYQNQTEAAVELLEHLAKHPQPEGYDRLARRILKQMGYAPS